MRTGLWLRLAVIPLGTGCAHPAVLPVEHVVIYRNGVSYIERAGHVGSGGVRFKMKQSQVGDFLATVEVLDHQGGSIRAAALPVKAPEGEQDAKHDVETVALTVENGHDIQVGYIAASPVWKPSYRLVLQPGGQAELQVWALVQNLSGEDWNRVHLSLIAGAPIAYASDLESAVIPERPTVSDRGESVGAVPHSETTLSQQAPRPQALNQSLQTGRVIPTAAVAAPHTGNRPTALKSAAMDSGYAMDDALVYPRSKPTSEPATPGSSASPLATIALQGGTTRYDLPTTVTIPDESATMLMVLSIRTAGEEIFLYAPDAQIPESSSHTFRAARFVNATGGDLEGGPIAMFERGTFLGQAVIDPLPGGATATMPFAVERSIAVESDVRSEDVSDIARLVKVGGGELRIAHERSTATTYRLRNGGDTAAKVFVRHRRIARASLHSPPAGTEDNVGTGSALVPTTVPPRETSELVIDERLAETRPVDWLSDTADQAVKAYLADPKSDRATVAKLASAWADRTDVATNTRERAHLKQQVYDLTLETDEIRRNLKALGVADAARAKLTRRLAEAVSQIADAGRKTVALDAAIANATDGYKQAIAEVSLP